MQRHYSTVDKMFGKINLRYYDMNINSRDYFAGIALKVALQPDKLEQFKKYANENNIDVTKVVASWCYEYAISMETRSNTPS